MKTANPASVTATFVYAVLSLILPASAMAAEQAVQLHRELAPAYEPANPRDRVDALRNDPILRSKWGPGDPDLVVSQFNFRLGPARSALPAEPLAMHDKPDRDHEVSRPW
jgi:hypothetical protein